MTDVLRQARSALEKAREEILWWVDEHGCCKGHEAEALAAIDDAVSAAAPQPEAGEAPQLDMSHCRPWADSINRCLRCDNKFGQCPRYIDAQRRRKAVLQESRSLAQNSLLHALLTEIAETRDWAGSRRSVECWKRLFVASWCRAKGESVEVLPALDGNGIDVVFRRTSEMSKAEVSDLVEYIHAWHAQQETT
jgi:hypothetical protein